MSSTLSTVDVQRYGCMINLLESALIKFVMQVKLLPASALGVLVELNQAIVTGIFHHYGYFDTSLIT